MGAAGGSERRPRRAFYHVDLAVGHVGMPYCRRLYPGDRAGIWRRGYLVGHVPGLGGARGIFLLAFGQRPLVMEIHQTRGGALNRRMRIGIVLLTGVRSKKNFYD